MQIKKKICWSIRVLQLIFITKLLKKSIAIPVTGCEGPQVCETSRFPHSLDNRLTDGGGVVSFTRRPSFTHGKIPASVRG
jgi:hypothetical protein